MITRTLPPEEWSRLAGTELEAVWPHLNRKQASVVVVEDEDGAIIGCWALMRVLHAEGVWIDPEYRRGGRVARRLVAAMKARAQELEARTIVTTTLSEDIADLARRLGGVALPGEHFIVAVEGL